MNRLTKAIAPAQLTRKGEGERGEGLGDAYQFGNCLITIK